MCVKRTGCFSLKIVIKEEMTCKNKNKWWRVLIKYSNAVCSPLRAIFYEKVTSRCVILYFDIVYHTHWITIKFLWSAYEKNISISTCGSDKNPSIMFQNVSFKTWYNAASIPLIEMFGIWRSGVRNRDFWQPCRKCQVYDLSVTIQCLSTYRRHLADARM